MIINQISHIEMKNYPTNLTENQWQVMINFLNNDRKRKHSIRAQIQLPNATKFMRLN